MSMKINPITESFTCWAFEHVTNMRNPSDEENTVNKCIALAKKGGRIILAEVAYLILPLVAIVEVVVRGIFALLATGLSYCSSNETVQKVAAKTQDGVKFSGAAGVTSVAALVWNFTTTEELDAEDMLIEVFPCMEASSDDDLSVAGPAEIEDLTLEDGGPVADLTQIADLSLEDGEPVADLAKVIAALD